MTTTDEGLDTNRQYLDAAFEWAQLRVQLYVERRRPAAPAAAPAGSGGTDYWGKPQKQPPPVDPAARKAAMLEDLEARIALAGRRMIALENANPRPLLVQLSRRLRLTPYEKYLLLLCVSVEMDGAAAVLCAEALGDRDNPSMRHVTFDLCAAVFDRLDEVGGSGDQPRQWQYDRAPWLAMLPHRPLRKFRLIEITQAGAQPLAHSPVRADEYVTAYVQGDPEMARRLDDLLGRYVARMPVRRPDRPRLKLPPSQQAVADEVAARWGLAPAAAADDDAGAAAPAPVAQLAGPESGDKLLLAAEVAAGMKAELCRVRASLLPPHAGDPETLARLWERDSRLQSLVLYVDAQDLDGSAAGEPQSALARFLAAGGASRRFFLAVRDPWPRPGRDAFAVDVAKPQPDEQRDEWARVLTKLAENELQARDVEPQATADAVEGAGTDPDAQANGEGEGETVTCGETDAEAGASDHVDPAAAESASELAGQFSLSLTAIHEIAAEVTSGVDLLSSHSHLLPDRPRSLRDRVWDACRAHTRPRLEGLAQRLEPKATLRDLVLPRHLKQLLVRIARQVRHRGRVYHEWGFADRMSRGLGISALFAGESGTGKTMAAEVLAGALRLDLYRIDLSAVVNKYIGETEKNLRRLFDAADDGGCILFFDEADALFGKRTEVRDSHDRYANIEVNYLLQRMEAYRGLAILATNMKSSLDPAFMRRLRFVMDFPYPAAADRERIWRKALPRAARDGPSAVVEAGARADTRTRAPVGELDYRWLGRLSLSGGDIHNAALNAAFLAARRGAAGRGAEGGAAGAQVTMDVVLAAVRDELVKLDRPINEAELRWEPRKNASDRPREPRTRGAA